MKQLALAFLILGACSSDDGGGGTQVDAPITGGNKVTTVDCASATPAATVMSTLNNDSTYTPMASTVSVGAVVKFIMSADHNVAPFPGNDAGLVVDFGDTACLKFSAAGTYRFQCTSHTFQGTVTVQ